MKVYVAGPYSKGDVAVNVRTAIAAADALAARQFCPYLPHLTHFWHLVSPKPYEWWLEYDSIWLLQCDAVLRLSGASNGADQETKLAETAGIPVVHSIDALEDLREQRIKAQGRWFDTVATTTHSDGCRRCRGSGRVVDPDNEAADPYGMVFCPECSGSGAHIDGKGRGA